MSVQRTSMLISRVSRSASARTILHRNFAAFSQSAVRPSSLSLSTPFVAQKSAFRGLQTSAVRFGGGETDASLASKLAEELNYEKDNATALAGELPDWLAEFKESGTWKVVDKTGLDEVTLERTFGNEKLRLTFSISDLDNPPDTSDLQADGSEGAAIEAEDGEEAIPSFPIRCSLFISKPSAPAGTGSLVMDLLVEDGQFIIDNVSFYEDTKLAEDMTAEGDWKRRGTYVGPKFDNLDPAVQAEFEAFLAERGVDEGLAFFIPLYCEYKEQKEYVSWLGSVKKFIDQ